VEKYLVKNGKKLKYGYTTGTCATAATKAAIKILTTNEKIKVIKVMTPKGWELILDIEDIQIGENFVKCAIRKDSGDDPDITNGILIYSKVKFSNENKIFGGEGVGFVTKEGLPVEKGNSAINPVPLKMINNVLKEFDKFKFSVEIIIPKGRELAKKTFNPKLGIVGGISVLGTSGIVEPMSNTALKDSIAIELNQMKDKIGDSIIFTPGNYGRDYLLENNVNDDYIIKISNYIGFMLDKAIEMNVKNVLLVGHIGKLIKIAGGNFNTHSRVTDSRMEILTAFAALEGVNKKTLQEIFNSITTDLAIKYLLPEVDKNNFFNKIAEVIKNKTEKYTYDQLNIEVLIFSNKHGVLGKSKKYDILVKEFYE